MVQALLVLKRTTGFKVPRIIRRWLVLTLSEFLFEIFVLVQKFLERNISLPTNAFMLEKDFEHVIQPELFHSTLMARKRNQRQAIKRVIQLVERSDAKSIVSQRLEAVRWAVFIK